MVGIFAALGASVSWAYACFLWREQTKYFSVIKLNLIKNLLAFIIFSPILVNLDLFENYENILILILSGIIGIGLGDSLYISALKRIGTRKTLTIEATSPVLANILGSIFIGESVSLKQWLGTLIVTLSLIIITREKNLGGKDSFIIKGIYKEGLLFAFLSVLCAVIGAILSRFVLTNSTFSPLYTTEIRLLGSLFVLAPAIRYDSKQTINKISGELKLKLLVATILGTNLGILLQQTVFQVLPIGVGWTLLSTSPVVSLFFAKAEGDQINFISILMTLNTLLGIWIIFI
tara:strand:+ start:1374 stop:2243 length:870 start_codon:yes stop_codon:yes gene_type:complete